jgi:zinc D-Ala-D-Ala carboxypeptidase
MPTLLSEHFSLEEMVLSQEATRNRIDNTPGILERRNLTALCRELLEPIRDLIDEPIWITSGYRCRALNKAINGALHSQHIDGEAADIYCPGIAQRELFSLVRRSELEFDQLIDEFGSWVHVSYKRSGANRGAVLRARQEHNQVVYRTLRRKP